MLIGTYEHIVDPKGRLQVPSKLRSDLGELFIGTKGQGNCLYVFPINTWEALTSKLTGLPISSAAAQGFARMLAANAFECVPDGQGRILIPKPLRERIGLEKEAVIAGVLTRAEIWPKAAWESYSLALDEDYDKMFEQLGPLGV